jgi:type I restriction enzyme S subunit
MRETNLLSLSYGNIIQKDIDTAGGLLPENFEGYQIVEPGNIVLRLTDLQNDKRSLRQGLVTQRGIITSAYDAVEVQRDNDSRFWFYSLLALDLAKHYYSLGGGVRQSVKFADFPNDWVYRPDLATQRQIADFLDRETARIDLLIEKKRRLVELLEEEQAAFIERTVTNEFTFKPSIESAIHDDGWSLKRLKNVASRLKVGVVVNPSQYIDDEGEVPFLYGGDIREFVVDIASCRRMGAESSKKLIASQLHPGDVVVVRVGAPGVAAVIPDAVEEANCASIMCVTANGCSGDWLAYAFNTRFVRYQVEVVQYGAAQKQFNLEHAREFKIPVPPRELETSLLQLMQAHRDRGTSIIKRTQDSIDRLKEFRAALITAAVTGHIDVTTYAKSGSTDRRLDAIQEEMEA